MWNGVTIEGNTIYQAPGTANSGCWGIAVDAGYGSAEIFSKVVIRPARLTTSVRRLRRAAVRHSGYRLAHPMRQRP